MVNGKPYGQGTPARREYRTDDGDGLVDKLASKAHCGCPRNRGDEMHSPPAVHCPGIRKRHLGRLTNNLLNGHGQAISKNQLSLFFGRLFMHSTPLLFNFGHSRSIILSTTRALQEQYTSEDGGTKG